MCGLPAFPLLCLYSGGYVRGEEVGSEMVLPEEGDGGDGPGLLRAGGEAVPPDVEGTTGP